MDDRSHPHTQKLFCFGYGYVAEHLATELKRQDPSWQICGTTRDLDKLSLMREDGIKAYLYSDETPFHDPLLILSGVTHILISIPPNAHGDIVFQTHARDILQIPTIEWIGYCSSTSVYGNRDGEWVDETAEVKPTSERGSKRARAESAWLKMRRIAGIPINIFRLSGIYGIGRSALDGVRAGNTRRIHKEGHAFNRIHVDDIVQAMIASMSQPQPGDIYNLADNEPEPSHKLIEYACELLGQQPMPLVDYEDVDMAPMARSFYKENKRVNNEKIKNKLGIQLKYPDYKSGLKAIFEAE
jgi:nucleoside-diphosphate-sugar epimerase